MNHITSILSKCQGHTLLDVATGTGMYAVVARDAGFQVTAFDVRQDRVPWSEPNINWKLSTLQEFEYSGYDIILLCGILYHLTLSDQFDLLSKLKAPFIILNTHFKIDGPQKWDLGTQFQSGNLSGVNYYEGQLAKLSGSLKSAWNNEYSFWHTIPSLEWLFGVFGYKMTIINPWISEDRAFFLCKREGV